MADLLSSLYMYKLNLPIIVISSLADQRFFSLVFGYTVYLSYNCNIFYYLLVIIVNLLVMLIPNLTCQVL